MVVLPIVPQLNQFLEQKGAQRAGMRGACASLHTIFVLVERTHRSAPTPYRLDSHGMIAAYRKSAAIFKFSLCAARVVQLVALAVLRVASCSSSTYLKGCCACGKVRSHFFVLTQINTVHTRWPERHVMLVDLPVAEKVGNPK